MQQHLDLPTPTPRALPDDLVALLQDVPPEKITGVTETELREIVDEPLVRAALEKFGGRIVDIQVTKTLVQPELF